MSTLKIQRYLILCLLLCRALSLPSQPSTTPEYQLKAVFLYNFTQFVDWPNGTFASDGSPMVIGILGKDPFGSYLQETISGEKVNGHPLVIEHYNTVEEIKDCHILFINLPDAKKTEKAITELKGKNILTVGEAPDFLKQGGMIRFLNQKGKINLQVNLETTKEASLVISSKLLRLVDIYNPKQSN